MLSLLLAWAGASGCADLPALPAPLAWLEDQDDHPLVSRRLMLLEPGAAAPRVLLEPLLWTFDAHDSQAVAFLGDDVVVTGPVRRARSAPNVGLALHVVPTDGRPRVTIPGAVADHVFPAPDGRTLVFAGPDGLGYASSAEGTLRQGRVFPEALPHRLRTAAWNAAGDALYVSLAEGRGVEAGLWRVPYRAAGDPRFGEPARVGAGPAWPLRELRDGAWLATARVERETCTPHELRRARPDPDGADADGGDVLARDLHWNRAVAWRAGADGREGALAYARFPDGALVLDGVVRWTGPRPVDSLAWSPDGAWLAFETRDAENEPWVWALEVERGAAHRLGRGLRPAWGPPARAPRLETVDQVAVWTTSLDARRSRVEPPATVRVTDETIACRRRGGSARILFLTFERERDDLAYGIYALGGAKDDFPVPHPLGGDPVTWPDRDHGQALAHALTLSGVGPEPAAALVAAHGADWFAEGLRVFFVLPVPLEPYLSDLELDPECRALLVRMDLRP